MEPHLRPQGKIKETKLELSKESLLNLHRYSWVSSDADTKTFILADKRSIYAHISIQDPFSEQMFFWGEGAAGTR